MADEQIKADLNDHEFKAKLVLLAEMQQQANKKNLILQIANSIVGMLIFILLIVIVALGTK